jgi:hypothetical protein
MAVLLHRVRGHVREQKREKKKGGEKVPDSFLYCPSAKKDASFFLRPYIAPRDETTRFVIKASGTKIAS